MEWLAVALIIMGILFWYLGRKWEKTFRTPPMSVFKTPPLVSILIPAYDSEKVIERCIKSAKEADYPNKEIIVVNDSDDRTPEICKTLGVRCIQNKERKGKATALNKAAQVATGEIFFFLDADSSLDKDALKNSIPFFAEKRTGVVAPKFVVRNKNASWVTRMVTMENFYLNTVFKTHMFFGSMISFRGCGVAVRRSVFNELGGWANTLTEDNDFAAQTVSKGYKIQFARDSVVATDEPVTLNELSRQRFRWGKGAMHSWFNFRKAYSMTPQFFTHIYVYILLLLSVIFFFIYQMVSFLFPGASMGVFTLTAREVFTLLAIFAIPALLNLIASAAVGGLSYAGIMTYTERDRKKDILMVVPYLFIYVPLIVFYYFKGMGSGIRDRKRRTEQLLLKDW